MIASQSISLPAIRELLDILSSTMVSFSMVSLERKLAATQDFLAENPPIDVAVLG